MNTAEPVGWSTSARTTRRRSAIRVLFVCTAGRCRSPIAATLLERRLAQINSDVSVASLGFQVSGAPTPDLGLSLMAERGIDMPRHRSSPVSAQAIDNADLILAMTREHVREVVGLSPAAWPKTFTLIDFVRRAQQVGPRGRRQRLDDWLEAVGADRRPDDLLRRNADDEVADPYGQRAKVWNRVIDDLDDLVSTLPGLLRLKPNSAIADSDQSEARSA